MRAIGIALCLILVVACSEGSSAGSTTPEGSSTTSGAGPDGFQWSFDTDDQGLLVVDESEAPESDPEGGDALPEIYPEEVDEPDEDFCPIVSCEEAPPEIAEINPCTLVTREEWAAWRQVDPSSAQMISLEHGDACGFTTTEDSIRLAFAVFQGLGWLPFTVDSSNVTVGGYRATWSTTYPIPESSVLVIYLPDAEIVIEMSARPGVNNQVLLEGAIHFGGIILGRLPS